MYVACSCVHVQIVIYPLEKCAAEALIGDTIECTEYSLRIPLSYLVPDLLLTDLPPHLTVDIAQFQFNPQVSAYSILLCHYFGVGVMYIHMYVCDIVQHVCILILCVVWGVLHWDVHVGAVNSGREIGNGTCHP